MKRTLCLILTLCLLAAGLSVTAEEPVSAAVDAPVGEAWTAGADNGLSVDGGDTPIGDDFTAWSEDAAGFAVSAPEEDGVPVTVPDAGVTELVDAALEPSDPGQDIAADEAGAHVLAFFPGTQSQFSIEDDRDPDELFAAYVRPIFYGSRLRVPLAGNNAGRNLTGLDRKIYNYLKSAILQIADGSRASTTIEIPVTDIVGKTSFTARELGVWIDYIQDNTATSESRQRLSDAFFALIKWDVGLVCDALWNDCPYELYWYDRYKSCINTSGPGCWVSYDPDFEDCVVTATDDPIVINLPVLQQYAGSEAYTVNTGLIAGAKQAAANARAIVDRYADCSDYIKLYSYAIEICKLVTYNGPAAAEGWDMTELNPWKLIWVFDGDPDTNVVCEGYAVAFQYLCELSVFTSGIRSILVNGNAEGPHAWNVVRMDDGKNYVVDVTWMDEDFWDRYQIDDVYLAYWIRHERAGLFLVGGSGSVSGGYNVYYRSEGSTFRTYSEGTLKSYTASDLQLASGKYVLKGFVNILGKTYYNDGRSWLILGNTIDGVTYNFSTSGVLTDTIAPGWHTIDGKQFYFDENGLHAEHDIVTDPAVAPTCTESGLTEGKHCSVCGMVLLAQEEEPALGHLWGASSYTLADDGSTMSARHTCLRDADHQEAETVNTSAFTALQPTCTEAGKTTYTATFDNKAFGRRSTTREDIPAKGHDWRTVYEWYSDNGYVAATRTCANDSSHREWEDVYTTAVVAVEPTCTEMGQTTYTATFTNPGFTPQSKTVTDIPAKGHSWLSPTYTWSDDHATVTATQVCANDPAHIQTETVTTSSCVARYPTCTAKGTATYTARFVNWDFTTQYRDFEDIPPLGHRPVTDAAVPATYTSTGLTEGSHCARCGKVLVAQQIVPVLSKTRTSLTGAKVTAANQTYTGKPIRPAVKVKLNGKTLKQGTDYLVVSIKNNTDIGKARVTIEGVGSYAGTVTAAFRIDPKKVSGLKLKAGAGKLTASWKKASGAGGYEVQYGIKPNFAGAKTVTVKSAKTVKTTLKKLKSKKTYYVRVRAYRTVNRKKYVSAWSKTVSQKTK